MSLARTLKYCPHNMSEPVRHRFSLLRAGVDKFFNSEPLLSIDLLFCTAKPDKIYSILSTCFGPVSSLFQTSVEYA